MPHDVLLPMVIEAWIMIRVMIVVRAGDLSLLLELGFGSGLDMCCS